MALYGYQPPSITSHLKGHSKLQVVEDNLRHQQEVLQILKDNLVTSQSMMKQQVAINIAVKEVLRKRIGYFLGCNLTNRRPLAIE